MDRTHDRLAPTDHNADSPMLHIASNIDGLDLADLLTPEEQQTIRERAKLKVRDGKRKILDDLGFEWVREEDDSLLYAIPIQYIDLCYVANSTAAKLHIEGRYMDEASGIGVTYTCHLGSSGLNADHETRDAFLHAVASGHFWAPEGDIAIFKKRERPTLDLDEMLRGMAGAEAQDA